MEKKKPGRPAGAKTAVKETVPETKAAEAAAAVEVKETAGVKAAETKETDHQNSKENESGTGRTET